MPIPELAANGWLPPGVHDVTLEEIKQRFGHSSHSTRRNDFMLKLIEYIEEAKKCQYIKFIIVNGSFVSNKNDPGDIDILVVLVEDFDIGAQEIKPWEYNLIMRKRVITKYRGLDLYQAQEESSEYLTWLHLWSVNRDGQSKGILRVIL